jgi:orotidine-5'-phosphate decarboxylase
MAGTRHFGELLSARQAEGKSVCVGFDPDCGKIPVNIRQLTEDVEEQIVIFGTEIIDSTADLAAAFKPNIAFFAQYGASGLKALVRIIQYIHDRDPGVPVILDAKRGDIGHTNDGYVNEAFDWFKADAVTVNPYFGGTSLAPFLKRAEKGIIVLCRTSNPDSDEFQDMPVVIKDQEEIEVLSSLTDANGCVTCHSGYVTRDDRWIQVAPLYQHVAYRVSRHWNTNGNCALVVGATYPEETAQVRQIVGDMSLLIPGIGAQGGDLEATVRNGRIRMGVGGMMINSSRGIIYADYPRSEALHLDGLIRSYVNA